MTAALEIEATGAEGGAPEAGSGVARGARRPRLIHVDAMRPVKQLGVVTTHSLLFFAPAASVGLGASLLVTHVTRFAFMFISAGILAYAYPNLRRSSLKTFWRRRLVAVALPYATWTLIYFFMASLPFASIPVAFRSGGGLSASPTVTLERFGYLLLTGYYQLYFLVLLLEFYVIYPAFSALLRRTASHHGALLFASVALQCVLGGLEHWAVLPPWMEGFWATRELWNYQLYLVAGGVLALHYHEVHHWLGTHRRQVAWFTAASFALAEGWYLLGTTGVVRGLSGVDATDPFQPIALPFFLGAIASVYLVGVALTHPRLPRPLRRLVASGAENSYGIYLSQVLFITLLSAIGFRHLDSVLPWPVVVVLGVAIVFTLAWATTALLARLPGAKATAGRGRTSRRSVLTTVADCAPATTPGAVA